MSLVGRINWKLFHLKGFYFLFYGGAGALLPFLPVYLKQIGLTASETGVIVGFLPFLSSLMRPFLGGLVDRYKIHKPVFVTFCLLAGLLHASLLLVPFKVLSNGLSSASTRQDVITLNTNCTLPLAYMDLCTEYSNLEQAFGLRNGTISSAMNSSATPMIFCCLPDLSVNDTHLKVPSTEASRNSPFLTAEPVHTQEVTFILKDDFIVEEPCSIKLINATFYLRSPQLHVCPRHLWYKCHLELDNSTLSHQSNNTPDFTGAFWITFIILNFARLLHNTVASFTDGVAFHYLGEKRTLFGVQRVFGSIGFVVISVPLSVILHFNVKSDGTTNFGVSFFVYLAGMCLATLTAYFMTISFSQKAHNLCSAFCQLLKDKQILLTMLVATYSGAQFGILDSFLFWYLKQIGATQLILGLCVGTALGSEILFFFISSPIILRLGEATTLQISLLAAAVRLIGISFITSPWYGAVVQLLHGPAFSLMWAALAAYVSSISPPGMAVTSQTILGSLVFGIGYGTGSLLTGVLFDVIGAPWTFRMNGLLTALVSLVFTLLQRFCLKTSTHEEVTCEIHELTAGALLESSPDKADSSAVDT